MRTASRRARRLGGLLLLAATVCWALVRRRSRGVRWAEPPPALRTATQTGVPPATAPTEAQPGPARTGGEAETPLVGGQAATARTGGEAGTALAGGQAGATAEPGPLGEVPDDVLATDAGLSELPEPAADAVPADTLDEGTADGGADTVDETLVAELLAESPDTEVIVVDEAAYEQAVAGAAPAAPGIDEPTISIEREADDEAGREIPMPTVSEAPTGEIPAVTDDLRAVRGIGPTMESKLHGLGIVSYRQLAMLDGAELERVRAELSDFRNRIEREDWVGQARVLHREKYGRDPF